MKNFKKLEVGKSYRNRSGFVVQITEDDKTIYGFHGNDYGWYHSSGRYNIKGLKSPRDLVELIEEKPKPSRLALYGRLIQKKFVLYQIAVERGNLDRSLLIQDEIVNITERMQREENNQ